MNYRVKEIICVLFLIAFGFACTLTKQYRDTDISVYAQELADMTADRITEFDSSRLKKDYGYGFGGFSQVCYYGFETVMESQTLLVIKFDEASKEEAESLYESIKLKRESLKELFHSYAIDQYELLDNSILSIEGNYLFYCVSKDAQAVHERFLEKVSR